MQILFIHGNYPAQFHWLAEGLARQGQHDVRFLTARANATSQPIAKLAVELYQEPEAIADVPALVQSTAAAINRASVIHQRLQELAAAGFVPRLVVVHGGNGLALLIKQLIPNCAVIGYFEWYFQTSSAALLLGVASRQSFCQVQLRNLVITQELVDCDAAVVPTAWQAQQFPKYLRHKLQVIFDGVDSRHCQPPKNPERDWPLKISGESGSLELQGRQPVLTYATRGMEPLRGFPEFMRALPAVLAALPDLQVVVAGRDRSAYGAQAPSHGGSWRSKLLDELGAFPGRERVHFVGLLSRGEYVQLLQRTNLHCYFSRPYVPSWSLFEAVACGSPILTNPGETTTGTLPGILPNTVGLDSGEATIAAKIIEGINAPTETGQAPEWIWRKNSEQRWQELINTTLQQTKQGAAGN